MKGERPPPSWGSAPDIELRQIRHALALVEAGSVAAASAQLQLSPSSLSRSVASLENRVGTKLFRRSSDGLHLTDIGRLFVERGKALVAAADDLDRLIGRNPSLHAGRLVIGLGAAAAEAAAAAVTAQLITEMPALTIELRSALRDDLVPALRQGELDMLVAQPHPFSTDADLELFDLPALPLVWVARRDHPLTTLRRPVEMKDIFEYPLYAGGRLQPRLLQDVLQEQSRIASPSARTRPFPALIGNSVAMLHRIVQQTDAVAAGSPLLIRDLVAAGRLVVLGAPAWLRNPYAVVRPRSRTPSPVADLFCQRMVAAHEAEGIEARSLIEAWLPGGGQGA
jgi:LysR family transcriptional regulator, pca operon transcriptional activator